jgi:hypothetical protein
VAKIRHLAILGKDTLSLAQFYMDTFEMHEVARQTWEDRPPAIYLSDGYINLAVLPAGDRPEGMYHFGFQVDDVEETGRVAKEAGAQTGIAPRPRDGRFAEFRLHDPVGTPVDLAEQGWTV